MFFQEFFEEKKNAKENKPYVGFEPEKIALLEHHTTKLAPRLHAVRVHNTSGYHNNFTICLFSQKIFKIATQLRHQ